MGCRLWWLVVPAALAKTQYREISQVTRDKYRNASWYYDAFGLPALVARRPTGLNLAFIGDSVARNQMQFLCDVVGSRPVEVRHGLVCRGRGVFCALRVFDGGADPWRMGRAGDVVKALGRLVPAGPGFDAVYFGSTALHMLQLLPAVRWRGWPVAAAMRSELRAAAAAIRACPVFMTTNWLCSARFQERPELPFGQVLRRAAGNATSLFLSAFRLFFFLPRARRAPTSADRYFERECGAVAGSADERAACAALSFTSAGSAAAYDLERAALAAAPGLRVVDSFAMTRDQCWATSDGIHYMPLLPHRIAALLGRVADCLSAS